MVGRDRPYGCKGYDDVTRTRFFNEIAEGKSVEQAAFRRVSRSTGFRWRSRISELGHAQAHPPGGGRPLKHSKLVAAVIYLCKARVVVGRNARANLSRNWGKGDRAHLHQGAEEAGSHAEEDTARKHPSEGVGESELLDQRAS